MATSEWRQTIKQGFGRGKVSEDDMRAALRRARKPLGPPEAPWEGIGYDWLEGLVFQPDEQTRQLTLQILLDAGIEPNGGAASFAHLSGEKKRNKELEFFKLVHARRNQSDASNRVKIGIPKLSSELIEGFYLPWLGRTAWVGRDLPDLPLLLRRWLEAGADPNFQPCAKAGKEGVSSTIGDAVSQPCSSWHAILATGRMDVLEAVLEHMPDGSPADWASAVATAFRVAAENHVSMEHVSECVERFSKRFQPTEVDRKAVFRLLFGKPGASFVYSPDALAAWLVTPCSGFREMAPGSKGVLAKFNPWDLIGRWGRYDKEVQARLFEATRVHPHWGNPKALLDSRLHRQSRSLWKVPKKATTIDGWLLAPTESWNAGLEELLPKFLDLVDEWGLSPSSAFGEALALELREPSVIATRWLASHGHEWVERGEGGKTPWHYAPERPPIWRWLQEESIDPKKPDEDGVPGMVSAAVQYLSRRSHVLYENAHLVVASWRPEERFGVVDGLDWSAWETVRSKTRATSDSVSPAKQLEAAWALQEARAVEAWVKRFPGFSWSELSVDEQRRLLMCVATSVPEWRKIGAGNHMDSDDALARCLELVRQSSDLTGLEPSVFNGWFKAMASSQPVSFSGLVNGMNEAWAWLSGATPEALDKEDRYQIIRLWWSALHSKRLADNRDGNAWELWPWDAPTWKSMSEADKGSLALGVLRFAMHKKHERGGSFSQFSMHWLRLFDEHLLEGRPERLVEFSSLKERRILQRLVEGRLDSWARKAGLPMPSFALSSLAMIRQQRWEGEWDETSYPVAKNRMRL